LRNRQRTRIVDLRRLRRIAAWLLRDLLEAEQFDLGIYLVSTTEITRLNEAFLQHKGLTDVITFNYAEKAAPASGGLGFGAAARRFTAGRDACSSPLHGEIFICADAAVTQARRFRTSWQSELIRYLIHGLLHLRGYDDQNALARRQMKREEDRLLRRVAARFNERIGSCSPPPLSTLNHFNGPSPACGGRGAKSRRK
jgi:probable rRNA maturation factor